MEDPHTATLFHNSNHARMAVDGDDSVCLSGDDGLNHTQEVRITSPCKESLPFETGATRPQNCDLPRRLKKCSRVRLCEPVTQCSLCSAVLARSQELRQSSKKRKRTSHLTRKCEMTEVRHRGATGPNQSEKASASSGKARGTTNGGNLTSASRSRSCAPARPCRHDG